jgi:metal-dependent amidase/aminoacylase/carboxypeptidase family protein
MATQKDKVRDAIYARRDQLVGLAHEIHEHPELAFCEEYAAMRLTKFLADAGFAIRKEIYGMPTAFVATTGHGSLHVAFCAEYDALPPACLFDRSKPPGLVEVWLNPERQDAPLLHACGHSVIAGAAVAAAIGLQDIADEVGLTVSVFGTPGEELVGLPEPQEGFLAAGKIAILEGGGFDNVHAVLMIHPGPTPWSMFIPTHVYLRRRARFSPAADGRHPLGIADLKLLEEALKQTILTLNQVPALFAARPEDEQAGARADFLWIAETGEEATGARDAVDRCFDEAASSAGVEVEVIEYAPGAELCNDPLLSASFRKNSEALGSLRGRDANIQQEIRDVFSDPRIPWIARILARFSPRFISPPGLFMKKAPVKVVYGTDLANVSQVIPAIHPMIGIGGTAGPHLAEFAADVDTDEAYRAMLDGGIALAWTALDSATDPAIKTHLLESASARNGSILG